MKERYGRGVPLNFTKEQLEFVKQNCTKYIRRELCEIMAKRFSDLDPRLRDPEVFAQKIRRLRMPCKKKYGCPKGHPVGTIVEPKGGLSARIKVSNDPVAWQALHRYIWEQHNGRKLKSDEIVRFLDGDTNNRDPENLIAVTKAANSRINAENRADTSCPTLNKTIILAEQLKADSRQIMKDRNIKDD